MNAVKLVFISLVTSFILAAPLMRLFSYFFSSGGSFIGGGVLNYYVASLFGLTFSVPFSFGFFGSFYFGRQYKKLSFFVIIPTLISDFVWGIDGNLLDLLVPLAINLLFITMGVGIGFLSGSYFKKSLNNSRL